MSLKRHLYIAVLRQSLFSSELKGGMLEGVNLLYCIMQLLAGHTILLGNKGADNAQKSEDVMRMRTLDYWGFPLGRAYFHTWPNRQLEVRKQRLFVMS